MPFRGEDHLIARCEDARTPVWIDETEAVIRIGGRPEHAPRRLLDFLKRQACRTLQTRSIELAAKLGLRLKRVTVRDTASRWGSCSSTRSLSFSWRLILGRSPSSSIRRGARGGASFAR